MTARLIKESRSMLPVLLIGAAVLLACLGLESGNGRLFFATLLYCVFCAVVGIGAVGFEMSHDMHLQMLTQPVPHSEFVVKAIQVLGKEKRLVKELLNVLTPFFLGNAPLAESPAGMAWTQGKATLAEGDLLLLASDGLEENVSGLDLAGVEALVRGEGSLAKRVEALVERATDPAQGGGRDNLAVVLSAVS